jgi:hypothetical protein
MGSLRVCAVVSVLAVGGVFVSDASASMIVRHMGLQQMCTAAGRIFRGTVLGRSEGTVSAGGGQLSTVIYRLRVAENFKGAFDTIKGQRIVTLQMVRGAKRPVQAGPARYLATFDDLPDLAEGQDYLVLATVPSAAGLSVPVGLKQGVFTLAGKAGRETALNGNDNIGLQSGIRGAAARGPLPYASLRTSIHRFLGR